MKVILGSGCDLNPDGLPAGCAACGEGFDERGGVLFEKKLGQRETGLCADCTNDVVETAHRDISKEIV